MNTVIYMLLFSVVTALKLFVVIKTISYNTSLKKFSTESKSIEITSETCLRQKNYLVLVNVVVYNNKTTNCSMLVGNVWLHKLYNNNVQIIVQKIILFFSFFSDCH